MGTTYTLKYREENPMLVIIATSEQIGNGNYVSTYSNNMAKMKSWASNSNVINVNSRQPVWLNCNCTFKSHMDRIIYRKISYVSQICYISNSRIMPVCIDK